MHNKTGAFELPINRNMRRIYMSTMIFDKSFFSEIAENFTFINDSCELRGVLHPVMEQYKDVREFVNELSKANLRSWRVAYPNANRYRHDKLPRTKKLNSKPFDIRVLIKNLNSLDYNIDYDCKALRVLKEVNHKIQLDWISTEKLDEALFTLPEKQLVFWNFRLLYDALESLKFNSFAHCSSYLKELNWDGVSTLNPNNKQCYGLKRIVGGIRVEYLRCMNARINEKFTIGPSNSFNEKSLGDIVLYALKVVVKVLSLVEGRIKELLNKIFNHLFDDYLYNRNLSVVL